jgi:N-acetyl-anhydromuramyl-L-alanine amidase AmpD
MISYFNFGGINSILANSLGNEGEEHVKIIEELLPEQSSKPRTKAVTHIVVHFISNASKRPEKPYELEEIKNTLMEYGASCHYVIDRVGNIYTFVPENRVAYHAGKGKLSEYPEYENKLNEYSIGIELLAIGTEEDMLKIIDENAFDLVKSSDRGYTDAQYNSLNWLINDMLSRNPYVKRDRQHIIGHDEYAKGRKTDPGALFNWDKIKF